MRIGRREGFHQKRHALRCISPGWPVFHAVWRHRAEFACSLSPSPGCAGICLWDLHSVDWRCVPPDSRRPLGDDAVDLSFLDFGGPGRPWPTTQKPETKTPPSQMTEAFWESGVPSKTRTCDLRVRNGVGGNRNHEESWDSKGLEMIPKRAKQGFSGPNPTAVPPSPATGAGRRGLRSLPQRDSDGTAGRERRSRRSLNHPSTLPATGRRVICPVRARSAR